VSIRQAVPNVSIVQSLRPVQIVETRNANSFGARDRRRYLRWLFEAKKRFGLSVLNYMVTSNHIHLLIRDTSPNVIAE